MEEPQLRLKDPINVRWLAMENAVTAVHKCYGSVVAYLESNEGKNTVGDVIADGLLQYRSGGFSKFPMNRWG